MCSASALPPKLGTTLLVKLLKTSNEVFNRNILNYYADTDETETNYYLKDPHMMKSENAYAKYGPVGVCGYLQDEYGFFFKNGLWTDFIDSTVLEGNTSPEKGAYDNSDHPCSDG